MLQNTVLCFASTNANTFQNAGASTAKVCIYNRSGVLVVENNAVALSASVEGDHH